MSLIEIALIAASAAATLGLALAWLQRAEPRRDLFPAGDDIALLYHGPSLHHISDAAARWFPLQPGVHDWEDLRDIAQDQFSDFPDGPSNGDVRLINQLSDRGDMFTSVSLTRHGDQTRVVFHKTAAGSETDTLVPATTSPKLFVAEIAPNPIWQKDAAGNVIWQNAAFGALDTAQGHPLSNLKTTGWLSGTAKRHRVPGQDGTPDKWYDVTRTEIDGSDVFHTQDASSLVAAEDAQRNFVQTLAKTFAHLSIGLAIFDRNGQLALFNPALVDLSGLDAQFLSARPTMLSFFDRLRETRRMPEPKNYRSWRQEIADVIAAASDGRYQESWSLETGQTYRVTGRPHPDGATAFLVEDISAEVTLTRNFRAELELGQTMLDTVEDGLVVFSRSGVLAVCNAAYRDMWQLDPENSFAEVTIRDSIAAWRDACAPTDVWPQIERYAFTHADRKVMTFNIRKSDGTPLQCQAHPVASGETLLKFLPSSKATAPQAKAKKSDILR